MENLVVHNGVLKSKEELELHYQPVKDSFWTQIKKHHVFYIMLFPCLLFFLIFSYWPMGGLVLAFKEYGFQTGIFGGDWVGLQYFQQFFSDPRSTIYINNTIIVSFLKLFIAMPFPIILALMFNEVQNNKLRGTFQSISYLPYFISWVVVVGLMNRLLAPDTGLINQMIAAFGGDGSTFFMMEEGLFYPLVFISYIWKGIGWDSIIYYAAIVAIAPALYEAAAIDGAGKLRQIWHVTLPGIAATIIILFILSLGDILSSGFDQIYLMQNPGNADVSETIDTYIVRTGLQGGQFGYATAIGLMQGVAGLILTIIVNRITSKKFGSSLW
ncbi:putative aldouronate transport system permease protein [Oceanobacillus polygoni]|uniref:Aldouronate transport system permease protein n=2 Tax=Oceanobacillus polygoni TaxID=1235259 RepID=A0A9X0YVS2_9BACI|nr:putative aldouronate transport system permease protein [Oceanobacillus polygoni]